MSEFDAVAPSFDRHRALSDGVAESVRALIVDSVDLPCPPRILDVGAGTGRIGRAFVAAGDDYVGVDLSFGMLLRFRRLAMVGEPSSRLIQADGRNLPFRDATFDAVMLVQIFGGLTAWRQVLVEAKRILRPAGTMAIGRTVRPFDGVDSQMRRRLRSLLDEMDVEPGRSNTRENAERWLESIAERGGCKVAASWTADRTPGGFLERHRSGAQFTRLPSIVREQALERLGAWAITTFGSLDAVFPEQHSFELQFYTFR